MGLSSYVVFYSRGSPGFNPVSMVISSTLQASLTFPFPREICFIPSPQGLFLASQLPFSPWTTWLSF